MKTYRFLGILVAAVILPLAGCDNVEDEVPDAGNDQKVVVKFTGGWGDGSARTVWNKNDDGFTVTWKGKNDDTPEYDKVGICIRTEGNLSITDIKDNACYHPINSEASSPLEIEQGQEPTLQAGTYNFYSYYPYNSKNDNKPSITSFDISDFWAQKQSAPDNLTHIPKYDLLWAVNQKISITEGTRPSSVNFEYDHLFSCLQFEITNKSDGPVTIKQLKLLDCNINVNCIKNTSLDLITGQMSNPGTPIYITLEIENPSELKVDETQTFWMMICPVNQKTITLELRRNINEGYFSSKEDLITPDMKAEVNYIIKLKLTGTGNYPTLEYNKPAS